MIEGVYLERGEPVVVLARWDGRGPRNVLVERSDGTRVVRPFRGLRRVPNPGRRGRVDAHPDDGRHLSGEPLLRHPVDRVDADEAEDTVA
jgi:hypothetical protein